MGRRLIDRVSDPVRRHLMTSLFYAPSLGALAMAGGLIPAALASGMFTTFAVYSCLRLKIERQNLQKLKEGLSPELLGMRMSVPVKVQEECDGLSRKFGLASSPRVFVYPNEYAFAFATEDNNIGFNKKTLSSLRGEQRRWVIAHELAHIKAGDTKVNHAMMKISYFMEAAAGGIGGISALQMAGHAGPVLGGIVGLTTAFATNRVRRYLIAYDSRSMERRRDYEALQITADLPAAIGAVKKLDHLKGYDGMRLREKWLHTHPVGEARIRNLITAYEDGISHGIITPPEAAAPGL